MNEDGSRVTSPKSPSIGEAAEVGDSKGDVVGTRGSSERDDLEETKHDHEHKSDEPSQPVESQSSSTNGMSDDADSHRSGSGMDSGDSPDDAVQAQQNNSKIDRIIDVTTPKFQPLSAPSDDKLPRLNGSLHNNDNTNISPSKTPRGGLAEEEEMNGRQEDEEEEEYIRSHRSSRASAASAAHKDRMV